MLFKGKILNWFRSQNYNAEYIYRKENGVRKFFCFLKWSEQVEMQKFQQ